MRKVVALLTVMLIPAVAQDMPAKSLKAGECKVATTEPVNYCDKRAKAIDKDGAKDGKCKTCETKLKVIALCVKKAYHCGCGGGCCTVDSPTPGKCKCNKPLKEEVDRCMVVFKCKVCDASGPIMADVKHDDEKHKTKKDKTCAKSCEKSGSAPHNN